MGKIDSLAYASGRYRHDKYYSLIAQFGLTVSLIYPNWLWYEKRDHIKVKKFIEDIMALLLGSIFQLTDQCPHRLLVKLK